MSDSPGGAAAMRATTSFGFRYQYLAGGANTGQGWSTWNPDGSFATNYIQESVQSGMIPVFTYYMLLQSLPGASGGEDSAVYANLQNASTMNSYYQDLKLLFQRSGAFSGTPVVVHVEPDAWGFVELRASGDNAATIPAKVGASGMSDLSGLPDNLSGFAQGIVRLRDLYAPNVVLAYHLSVWGTGNDILYSRPSDSTVHSLATRAGNYFRSLNANFDLVFAEFSDRDAAFKQFQYGDNGASWWGPGDFSRNELYIGTFVDVAQKRVAFWQIPYGNTKMRRQNNTWNHYQDNHVEWLLDDPSRDNLSAYANRGVVAFLFGRGADGATCACSVGDTGPDPAPINGNTEISLNGDADGGFFRQKAAAYYAAGPMALPSSSGGPPTATPSPMPTSTPMPDSTATPTPMPSPTPGSGSDTRVTFDDLGNPNRPLTGQYPSGVIDWGSSGWFLSGPWGQFSGNSVSLTQGRTTASFSVQGTGRLVQLDAYNGGSVPSTVTFGCPGRPSVQSTVGAGQLATLRTGWTTACSAVSISSTNGWDTNFKSLVLSNSDAAAPTPTPTRTPTPVSNGETTVTFDGAQNPNRPLTGQYPSGIIDWGSGGAWYLSRPYGQFTGNSLSFNGHSVTSASFDFAGARRLIRLQAYNGGNSGTNVTLSCAGQPTTTAPVPAGQLRTIQTGWTGACTHVTIASSNGWDTNFNSLVIQ